LVSEQQICFTDLLLRIFPALTFLRCQFAFAVGIDYITIIKS